MNFNLTTAQQRLYQTVFEFARSELNKENIDSESRFPRHKWKKCGEFGLLGLCIPEAYGGKGLDQLSTAVCIQAFGRGCEDMGLVFSVSAHLLAVARPIVDSGGEALKQYALPKLASGEWIGANAITEAEAGSDIFSLQARSERKGDDYQITGCKTHASNGAVADLFLVYANSDPEKGYLGIDAFAIERNTAGVTIGEAISKMGLETCLASPLLLDHVLVNQRNRLGAPGGGAEVFNISMQWERSCLFAGYVGAMERQLELVIDYASRRKQQRRPIGRYQGVSHRISDMKLRLESARLLLYKACWARDRGDDAVMDVSLAKLAISEAAIQNSLDAIQIFGAAGYSRDNAIEVMLRDAIPATIFSGTSEIQRNLIASRLGL